MPGLLDQYRLRHREWIAQAEELIRLRDQVRTAAEREAIEIVTTARRDVRRVVVEARRELLVLTAQLQAAVDSADQLVPGTLAPTAQLGADAESGSLGDARDLVRGARRDVRSVLDEARAELDELIAEAPLPARPSVASRRSATAGSPETRVPTQAGDLDARASDAPAPPRSSTLEDHDDLGPLPTLASLTESPGAPTAPVAEPDVLDSVFGSEWLAGHLPPVRTPDASRADARAGSPDVPASSTLEADVPLAPDGRPERSRVFGLGDARSASGGVGGLGQGRQVIPIVVGTGLALLLGTFLWLRSGEKASPPSPPAERAAGPETTSPSAGTRVPPATDSSLSLVIEARKPAWIRTTIDGQEENGRMYGAGETRQIVGARSVAIRAGDGGAVFVALAGGASEALGAEGTVVTKRFGSEDQSPVSKASASPVAIPSASPPGARPRPASAVVPPPVVTPSPRGRAGALGTPAAPAVAPASATLPRPSVAAAPVRGGADAPRGEAGVTRTDLVAAGEQWLEAYHRRDRDGMSVAGSEGTRISDERSANERAAGQTGVRRDLDQVELELTGDTALLTGRMTERVDGAGAAAPLVSRVSQVWVRRAGRWHLSDVRIIGEGRLSQLVR